MNLKDLKFSSFDAISQILTFDEQGVVTDSDNTLAKLEPGTSNVFEVFAFLEGMQEVVFSVQEGKPLAFNCVHLSFIGYESHFDFTIQKLPEKGRYSLLVTDFKEQYRRVFELQQERNIRDIETKKLERDKKRIMEEKEAIKRLYADFQQSGSSEFVLVKSDNLLVNVDLNSVKYFEAYGDYIKVHTEDKMYIIHNRMKNIEDQLPPGKFKRVHRSFIVPLDKIKNIEQMSLSVADKIIPIGKQYKQDLLKEMKML